MLIRVALVAPPGKSQQELRTLLSRPLVYSVREFTSLAEVQQGLATFPFQALVARFQAFNVSHVSTIVKLHEVFPKAGILSVSPTIEPQARYMARALERHVFVDERIELADLDQLINKTQAPFQPRGFWTGRLHPRAKRNDQAMLVTKEEGRRDEILHDIKFVDFARMGARVLSNATDDLGLTVKSRVELRYTSSEDPGHVHRIEAKVVWIKKASSLETLLAGAKTMLGLRFVAEL